MLVALIGVGGVVVGYLLNFVSQWYLARRSALEATTEIRRFAYSDFLTNANAATRLVKELVVIPKRIASEDTSTPGWLHDQRLERLRSFDSEFRVVAESMDRSISNLHLVAPPEVQRVATALQQHIWDLRQDAADVESPASSEIYQRCTLAFKLDLFYGADTVPSKHLRRLARIVGGKSKAIEAILKSVTPLQQTASVDSPLSTDEDTSQVDPA